MDHPPLPPLFIHSTICADGKAEDVAGTYTPSHEEERGSEGIAPRILNLGITPERIKIKFAQQLLVRIVNTKFKSYLFSRLQSSELKRTNDNDHRCMSSFSAL
jgi:hypothetical protein